MCANFEFCAHLLAEKVVCSVRAVQTKRDGAQKSLFEHICRQK